MGKAGMMSAHYRNLRKREEMTAEELEEKRKKAREYWHKNKHRYKNERDI